MVVLLAIVFVFVSVNSFIYMYRKKKQDERRVVLWRKARVERRLWRHACQSVQPALPRVFIQRQRPSAPIPIPKRRRLGCDW